MVSGPWVWESVVHRCAAGNRVMRPLFQGERGKRPPQASLDWPMSTPALEALSRGGPLPPSVDRLLDQATPRHTLVGLEATGHFWENLEAFLSRAGYRVVVLNP